MSTGVRPCCHCGQFLSAGARSCAYCGAEVPLSESDAEDAPPSLASGSDKAETIIQVIPLQRRRGLLGLSVENFNMIVTQQRLLLIPVHKREMQEALKQTREQSRASGKGFLEQWGAMLSWLQVLYQKYQSTPLAELAQVPGSLVFWNSDVRSIRLREPRVIRDRGTVRQLDAYSQITIETVRGAYTFDLLTMKAGEARNVLQQTLGGVVR